MTRRKVVQRFTPRMSSRIVTALLNSKVNELRHLGLTERAIARKLGIPRWAIRTVN